MGVTNVGQLIFGIRSRAGPKQFLYNKFETHAEYW